MMGKSFVHFFSHTCAHTRWALRRGFGSIRKGGKDLAEFEGTALKGQGHQVNMLFDRLTGNVQGQGSISKVMWLRPKVKWVSSAQFDKLVNK